MDFSHPDLHIVAEVAAHPGVRVLRARDRTASIDVAVKVLIPEELGDERDRWISRFRREALLGETLRHASLTRLLRADLDRDRPFLVFEWIEGEPLDRVLDAWGPPAMAAVWALLREISNGLSVCHRGGVVHRDVKAGNILWTPEGRVVLADLGIARLDDGAPTRLVGTPAYMAPELFREAHPAPSADVFGLGVVVYEMLTGEAYLKNQSALEVARLKLDGAFPSWLGLADKVDAADVDFLSRMTHALPESRPDSEEVAFFAENRLRETELTTREALVGYGRDIQGDATDASIPRVDRSGEIDGVRRHAWTLLGGALVLGLGVGFGVYSLREATPSAPKYDEVVPEGFCLILLPNIATVGIDGVPIGTFSGQVRLSLSAGVHSVSVEAGETVATREVKVVPGQALTVDFRTPVAPVRELP